MATESPDDDEGNPVQVLAHLAMLEEAQGSSEASMDVAAVPAQHDNGQQGEDTSEGYQLEVYKGPPSQEGEEGNVSQNSAIADLSSHLQHQFLFLYARNKTAVFTVLLACLSHWN
ncbi:UNVERIFIED_CONTAM: hypothetical protein K2H54_061773 [Gekko kuhli]